MIDPDLDVAYLRAAAHRIRMLEAENASFADDLNEAIVRIKAMEAALREIAALEAVGMNWRSWLTMREIARAALAHWPQDAIDQEMIEHTDDGWSPAEGKDK